jgi:hypothetical protein
LRLGAAAKEIAACATQMDAELIVMGRDGGRVLRDVFVGSTAERVIRHAQRPGLERGVVHDVKHETEVTVGEHTLQIVLEHRAVRAQQQRGDARTAH